MSELSYRHKKFDQRQRGMKRAHDDHDDHDDHDEHDKEGHDFRPAPTSDFDISERLSMSPYSIRTESNCSTEFAVFSGQFRDTSTPLAKRRRLVDWQRLNEDSGISVTTPQKRSIERSTMPLTSLTPTKIKLERSIVTPISIPDVTAPPTASILPQISNETLRSICKYHGNMVRKFPKKERTPKDQDRRNKNTLACRMSRRVKKLEHIAIEEQYKEFAQQHMNIVEESIRAAIYLHELMKLKAIVASDGDGDGDAPAMAKSRLRYCPAVVEKKKPFSIAYLVGMENSLDH